MHMLWGNSAPRQIAKKIQPDAVSNQIQQNARQMHFKCPPYAKLLVDVRSHVINFLN